MLAAALLTARALIVPGSAIADSPAYCNEYANQAVISATQNASFHCGFTGSRWSFNYQEHYGWCVTAPHSQTVSERLIRHQGLWRDTSQTHQDIAGARKRVNCLERAVLSAIVVDIG